MNELAVGGWRLAGEISGLLRYPDDDLRLRLQFAQDVLEGRALQSVIAFSEETARVSLDGMQELYTRTFDLNPVATLEIGWHLYGEQYERGRFLAELREQQDAAGVDATPELPDHLTAILAMVPRLDARVATPLVEEKLLPALEKIGRPLEEQGNPYRHLIEAARAVVAPSVAPHPAFDLPLPAGGERKLTMDSSSNAVLHRPDANVESLRPAQRGEGGSLASARDRLRPGEGRLPEGKQ